MAIDEVSFEVSDAEIFGLIGPNGAGKTTTMECIEGLRTPDRGAISVLGLDPFNDVYKLQERIGVQLQQAQLLFNAQTVRCRSYSDIPIFKEAKAEYAKLQ